MHRPPMLRTLRLRSPAEASMGRIIVGVRIGNYDAPEQRIEREQCRIAVDVVGHRLLHVPRLDLRGARRPAA